MFILTNGNVVLQPFKVEYEREVRKVIKEGYMDEEKQEMVAPEIEVKIRKECCYFADASQAAAYAEEVNGTVKDMTPKEEIVTALSSMTFSSLEEVRTFIETGVAPLPQVTLESLVEVVGDLIGGAI